MIRALALGLGCAVLVSCGGAQKPACSDNAIAATRLLYQEATKQVVDSGACDAYQAIADCPDYQAIQRAFDTAGTLWEHCE